MSLFPLARDWTKARTDAGMDTGSHDDIHAGELETSLLLHVAPQLVRPGNETADWIADEPPYLLTLGMTAYTTSGVIGRPSLGTADKGKAALDRLTHPSRTTCAFSVPSHSYSECYGRPLYVGLS